MRKYSLAAAAAVSVSLLGLTGAAQAQTVAPHATITASLKVTPGTVAAGPATGVNIKSPCPNGTRPSAATGFPAPNGTTTDLQASLAEAPKPVRIYGVWPAPASGTRSYTVKITCPGGQSGSGSVKVAAAPAATDITGVGSDTLGTVMDQFSADWNGSTSSGSTGRLYSFDAENPVTNALGDNIIPKQDCGALPRPNGSGAGITAITTENGTTGGHPCLDFARSSSPRGASNPDSITFDALAEDAVTYATQSTTNAPKNLTTADLTGIYNCTITNWKQIGGKSGTIAPFIPQPGSGTRSFFLAAIDVTTPGSCVSDDNGNLEESEGTNPVLNTDKANVIVPYSVGKYLAQRYHSAACLVAACTPNSSGLICSVSGTKDLFGCNNRGTLILGELNGTDPTTPWPLTDSTTGATINPSFSPTFLRYLYEVFNSPEFTIPAYLQKYFSSTGWVCTSATAKADIKDYGFLVLPAGTAPGDCGSLS